MRISQFVKAFPTGDDVAYEFMILLDRSLLPGLIRVTVVHTGTYDTIIIHLYEMRILEFAAVITVIPNSG